MEKYRSTLKLNCKKRDSFNRKENSSCADGRITCSNIQRELCEWKSQKVDGGKASRKQPIKCQQITERRKEKDIDDKCAVLQKKRKESQSHALIRKKERFSFVQCLYQGSTSQTLLDQRFWWKKKRQETKGKETKQNFLSELSVILVM